MTTFSKKQLIIFLLFLHIGIANSFAQDLEINGDTIYVNAEAEVMVRFPSLPTFFKTTPPNAPYNFKTAGTGFTISAKAEKTRPAPLLVMEGGRTHKFLIVFKKHIDYNNDAEMDYDYSTKKKLEQHILQNLAKNNNTKLNNPKEDKSAKATSRNINDENTISSYYAILEQGDKDIKEKNYSAARSQFEKAQKLRPGDQIPKLRLEEIKTKQAEDAKLVKAYNDYIASGEKAIKKNNLTEARVAFEQAIIVKKDDATAIARLKTIAEKEKLQTIKDKQESDYSALISEADKLFNAADYTDARTAYDKALLYKKDKWPQEQLKKIAKLQTELVTKQKEEEKANLKENELYAEKVKKDKTYNDAINAADKYFAAKDYSNAVIAYNKALTYYKRDWPANQLKKISQIQIAKEAEDKKAIVKAESEKQAKERKQQEEKEKIARGKEYKTTVGNADKLFKKKDYAAAKEAYLKAAMLTDKTYPQEQIAAIDKITEDLAAKENAEKMRLAKEAELNTRYNSIVKNADAEFSKSNFIKARKLYNDAMALKPEEKLPKEKLSMIQSKLAEIALAEKARREQLAKEQEQQKQYVLALSKGKSYFLTSEFEKAKESYTVAAGLKPGEEDPKKQLKVINEKLEALAKEEAINNKYENTIAIADSLLILKSYAAAIDSYNAALAIKPNEYYPHVQINYVNAEIKYEKNEKANNDILEAYNKEVEQENKYRDALKQGKQAIADKDYKSAKDIYKEILTYRPDDEYARHMVKVSDYQMQRESIAKTKQPDVTYNNNAVQPVSGAKEQKEEDKKITDAELLKTSSSPYTAAELKEKYPGIDFSNLPPEQPFNQEATNSLENVGIYKEILHEAPRLGISNKSNDITLTIQAINFEDTDAYFKLLIENNSKSDFLTGAMMLTWTKKAGNKIKLYPIYLYPAFLPIITPGNQAQVIYVCKNYFINDKEKLDFELTDRLNKTKINIAISGKKYNEGEIKY